MYTSAISQCSENFSMTRIFTFGSNMINEFIFIPKFPCLSLINIVIIYFPSKRAFMTLPAAVAKWVRSLAQQAKG